MKQNKLYLVQELLVTQINNLIFYPITLTLVTLLGAFITPVRTGLLLWMFCGLIFPILYLVRCNIKRIIPFFAIHLTVAACGLLLFFHYERWPFGGIQTLDNVVNRLMLLAMIIGYTIYSILLRLHEKTDSDNIPMPVAVGISAVALFLQHYQGNREWDAYYTISLIMVLAFYFLQFYLREYLNFIKVNAGSTGVFPEKEIFRSGFRLTFLYTAIGVLILLGTSQLTWLKSLLDMVKQFLSVIVRFIFSFVDLPELNPADELRITEPISNENGGERLLPDAVAEPAPVWTFLEYIVIFVIVVAGLFVLFITLRELFVYIRWVMSRRTASHEQELVDETRDVREKCDTSRTNRSKRQLSELFSFLDARERIRRIYKKKAQNYNPLILGEENTKEKRHFRPERLMFYTAKEMEKEMQAQPFAEIYEKARYSNEACTAQDVKRMKELCQ